MTESSWGDRSRRSASLFVKHAVGLKMCEREQVSSTSAACAARVQYSNTHVCSGLCVRVQIQPNVPLIVDSSGFVLSENKGFSLSSQASYNIRCTLLHFVVHSTHSAVQMVVVKCLTNCWKFAITQCSVRMRPANQCTKHHLSLPSPSLSIAVSNHISLQFC